MANHKVIHPRPRPKQRGVEPFSIPIKSLYSNASAMNPEANNSAHTPRRRSGSLPSQNAAAVQPRGSFVFRDEMGILHPSLHITPNTASAAPTLFQPTPRVGSNDPATNRRIKENESEAVRTLSMKAEDYDSGTAALEVQAPSPPAKKKTRKKWSLEETTMLVEGCRKVIC